MATMNLVLKVWQQENSRERGRMADYKVTDISDHMSFLGMLDVLNEQLIEQNEEPVVFDHNCREGVYGMCFLSINGGARGPNRRVTACQSRIRMFKDGDAITTRPWRATVFPATKDLVVDRTVFERIQQTRGYVSVNISGNTQDANAIPIPKRGAGCSMDAAAYVGCGTYVAICKNSSTILFVAARVSQFAPLPQGRIEATERILNTVNRMEHEGFGNCTNAGACEVEYPRGISLGNIARLNRKYLKTSIR